MIDFRYHLVSLVAVFLALALGILLGAGPLNQTIGDQLTGQVEELRGDLDQLRGELDVSQTEVANRDEYIDATAPAVLGSRLENRAVAVVTLPGATADDVADVRHRFEQAGATVTAEIAVTEAWTDPAGAAFRSSFAGQLLGYLEPAPEDAAAPGVILGTALGQGLTRGTADGELLAEARTLIDLLSSADEPLIELVDEPTTAANATAIVGPRADADSAEETEDDSEREDRLAVEAALAEGMATTGEGTVLSGSASSDLDLLTHVRATAPDSVTTADSVADIAGRVNVPLALAATISGSIDHYGFAADASIEMPPAAYLAPPAQPDGDAAADGESDGESGAGAEAAAADADAEAADVAQDEPATQDAG